MRISGQMIYEDGTPVGRYTVIPNDILDKTTDIDLTKEERKVLIRIIRNTVGYEEYKKKDGTSVRKLSNDLPEDYLIEKTELSSEEVASALESLEKRRIIRREGNEVTFNKNLDEWI